MIHYKEQPQTLWANLFESQPPNVNFLMPHLKTPPLGTNLINLPDNANCKISNLLVLTNISFNQLPQGS